MVEEKNVASNSRPKKSKFPKDVKNSSKLRRSLRRPAHQFDFSNDPIRVEEVEDSSKDREKGSAFVE